MSEFGGCIVCGVVLGKDDVLRCHDCVYNELMEQTGTKARFIQLTDTGPVELPTHFAHPIDFLWYTHDILDMHRGLMIPGCVYCDGDM